MRWAYVKKKNQLPPKDKVVRGVLRSWRIMPGFLVGFLALFFLLTLKAGAANSCVSAATGNWSAPGTWINCGGSFPGSADSVTIASGHIVTVDVDSAAASLTIGANSAVGGNGVTINPGKTLAVAGAVALSIPTAATTDLIVGSGTLAAGSITIPGSATANRFATVSVNTGTVTVTGNITFSGSAARARYTSTGASTTNIGGDFGSGGTLTTSGTGIINFNGAAAQTMGIYTTYSNIAVNKSGGSLVLSGTTTIGGTLDVTAGTMDIGAFTSTIAGTTTINSILMISSVTGTKAFGNIVINSGGLLNFTAAEGLSLNGNLTVNSTGTVSGVTGTMLFQKIGGGTINGTATATQSLASATFNTNYSVNIPLTVTGTTTVGAGITLTNNSTYTAAGALSGVTGAFTQGPTSVLNLASTSTINTLDASASPNDVHYTSTAANQTIHPSTYYNLFIDKSGRVGTLGNTITVSNNLMVSAGTLADGGFQITGNAVGALTLAAATTLTLGTAGSATSFPLFFTSPNVSLASGSTVNYGSNSAQAISDVPAYGNLTTTATAAVTKTAAGPITVNGTFTNGVNNTFGDGGFTITLKDGGVMTGTHTGTGKILLTGGSAAHAIAGTGSYHNVELDDIGGVSQSGTVNVSGTLTITNGTWTTNANTISVTGVTSVSGTIAITSVTGTKTFGNLIINTGGAMNFTAAEAVTVNGDLTVNGTGSITGSTGVWTFSKAGGGTIGGTVPSLEISGANTFTTNYSVLIPYTANTMTVNTGATVTNTDTVTNTSLAGAGAFIQNAGARLNLGGTASITTLNASATGNEVHYTSITAAQTLKGASYYDLFIEKLSRTGTVSGTTNVLNNLTVTAGTLTLGGSTLTVTGTTDIFGTLQDVNNTGLATFGGLITIHPGGSWDVNPAEACDFDFQNGFIFNGTSFVSGPGIYTFDTNDQTLVESTPITISNLVVNGIQLTNSGELTNIATLSGTGSVAQAAGATLNLNGVNTLAGFDASTTGNTVIYSGNSALTFKAATYSTLDLSSITNNNITIPANTTVNTSLILGATKFSTSSNALIMGTGATLSRTSGYVIGAIVKQFSTSSPFTFPLGDTNNYTPIDLTPTGVSGVGSIEATTFSTDHTDTVAGLSPIKPNDSVNRYWTLANNGLPLASYNAVLHFVSTDVDSGADVADMVVAKKSGGVWTIVPSSCSGTSCTLTGLTSMSDFQIGEATPAPLVPGFPATGSPSFSSTVNPPKVPINPNSPTATGINAGNLATQNQALFDITSEAIWLNRRQTAIVAVVIGGFILGGGVGVSFLVIKSRLRWRRIRSLV